MKSTDGYIRDPHNKGAVLNTDNAALKAYKLQKNKFREVNKLKNNLNEIETYEEIYNVIEVYLWLSKKFEKEFVEKELAKVMKDRVSKIIDSILRLQCDSN